ncbi:lasso peptide biosynthesis B2 protein [Synechococcus sp. CCY 0621]|uniref:lasso peptide biosynthesis B2 protein n=1 Tax=Synechococcus sp. CCY 0621 TaxID=2815603 RepID=UPI002570B065|nr:lasso peptide biosynthesis B2 protein [Synechococcus sp. CCY 0621]
MNSWRRKAGRFHELDGPSRRLVLGSAVLLPLFWLRVKVLGQCTLGPGRVGSTLAPQVDAAVRMGQLVNRVAHYVLPPDNCLSRSLCLQWLLRRRGIPADLRLGVQLDAGQLQAHAWVEVAGHPVNDAQDVAERFLPFEQPLSAQA